VRRALLEGRVGLLGVEHAGTAQGGPRRFQHGGAVRSGEQGHETVTNPKQAFDVIMHALKQFDDRVRKQWNDLWHDSYHRYDKFADDTSTRTNNLRKFVFNQFGAMGNFVQKRWHDMDVFVEKDFDGLVRWMEERISDLVGSFRSGGNTIAKVF